MIPEQINGNILQNKHKDIIKISLSIQIYSINCDKFMKELIILFFAIIGVTFTCNPCYREELNQNCAKDEVGKDSYTLHMSVHPHLDAYWIFNFESYYDPKPSEGEVHGYFMQNRFSSVKQIFTTAKNTLWESKRIRQQQSNNTQKAHRSFFNSEMGFFKRWYNQQSQPQKDKVKQILKTKYWEILGGGYVQHDQGCAYYDDIIQNFELGLHFLKQEFNYYPRVAVSADSFGHSQTSLAILAHLGVQGYFVQRSDEHMLLKNKTEFIWNAKSANGQIYGALPTHIRWAIHGFQDQFIGGGSGQNFCQTKQQYMNNLRNQNNFLKRILKSTHIMRYFGHDFQKFDDYSYSVIESMMEKFSMQKCNKITAVYGNPTQYFMTLMGEVFGQKIKPVVTRNEDIFPIWDYDSGLYWTGYYTTDAYHKKSYRDLGRFLHGVRKMFLSSHIDQSDVGKKAGNYLLMEKMAEQVSYLQHHDGISGTSKYRVMDSLQIANDDLIGKVTNTILNDVFINDFPEGTSNPVFYCNIGDICKIPQSNYGNIYLKIVNTDGSPSRDPIIVQIPPNQYYLPQSEHEINCFCYQEICPCKLYLYKQLFTYTSILLQKVDSFSNHKVNRLSPFVVDNEFSHNITHFNINHEGQFYSIGYKRIEAKPTSRFYDHLTRYGTQSPRSFSIRPGKYALGNDPNTVRDFSQIKKVSKLSSDRYTFFLIQWKRQKMTSLISIPNARKNQWKVQTITATQAYYMQDLYFEVATQIDNKNKFVTDSNGWLTVTRELFTHQDYQAFFSKEKFDDIDGNTYPATAFVYLEDQNNKVSVNLDRPQGVIAYRPGTLWINFDRLSEDDGKWVYQSAFRSEYQKYTHTITVKNKNYNERKIQRRYDQPLFIQGNSVSNDKKLEYFEADFDQRNEWNSVSNIDSLKFSIRPFNDSTTIVRVHNLDDKQELTVGLFAGNISPLLTTFYGRTVSFSKISERSLGGNMQYSEFINNKWNWNTVVDLNEANKIFNKIFRENITLRSLEIRTFMFHELKFAEKCIEVSELTYNKQQIAYDINTNKPIPRRQPITGIIQKNAINYLKEANHCDAISPILQKININIEPVEKAKDSTIFQATKIQKSVPVILKQPILPSPKISKPIQNRQKERIDAPIFPDQAKKDTQSIRSSLQIKLKIIESKISNLGPLTLQEKQIYFNHKLESIRKLKAKRQ